MSGQYSNQHRGLWGAMGLPEPTDAQLLEQKRIEAQAMGRGDPVEEIISRFLNEWDRDDNDMLPSEGARELLRRLGLRP